MKKQVKLRSSPAITDEQSDAKDVEEVKSHYIIRLFLSF